MNESNLPRTNFQWAVNLIRPKTTSRMNDMFFLPDLLNEQLNYVSSIELNGVSCPKAMEEARTEVFMQVKQWVADTFGVGWEPEGLTCMG